MPVSTPVSTPVDLPAPVDLPVSGSLPARTRARTPRRPTVDAACAEAVDLARAAAQELAGESEVGEHLGSEVEDDRVLTHYFACSLPGYSGWRWAVTVARASRSKIVTVDEAVLLPGPEAIRPPEWLPWSERLRPGDLGVGDLLPTAEDDVRLEPGYVFLPREEGDGDLDPYEEEPNVAWELGLGRARVLSPVGRDDAVDRWYCGDRGPGSAMAAAAPAQCSTCGFFVPLTGTFRRMFGVCANEYSPADAAVVAVDFGCGAHSEGAVMPTPMPVSAPIVDELRYEPLGLRAGEHQPGSVDDATPAEELGHS